MSDLISRSDTMKRLRDYAEQKHYNGEVELANGILKAVCFIEHEENIPTAYNVDAVVDALWDEQLDARQLMNEGKEWGAGCYSGLQIAIETIREFEKAGDNNENNN